MGWTRVGSMHSVSIFVYFDEISLLFVRYDERRGRKEEEREDFCFASTLLLTTWCSCVFWPETTDYHCQCFFHLFRTPRFHLLQNRRENEGVLNWRRAAAQQRSTLASCHLLGPPIMECWSCLLLFSAGGSFVISLLFAFIPSRAESNI